MIEVLLVEDDQLLLKALTRILSSAGYTVSAYCAAEPMLESLGLKSSSLAEVCILMDVNLGSMNGVDAQKIVRHLDADIPVVFMSAHQDALRVNQAWRDGASNFLFKPFTPKELLDAINDALQKRSTSTQAQTLARHQITATPAQLEQARLLTPRQRQVLKLVATGLTHQQISEKIGISPRTVKLHRAAMMHRLNCTNVPDLVRFYEAHKHLLYSPEVVSND